MRKIAPIAAIALFAVAFTSCKKDYTCTCTDSTGTDTYTIKDVKKAEAKTACTAWDNLYKIDGGSCSL